MKKLGTVLLAVGVVLALAAVWIPTFWVQLVWTSVVLLFVGASMHGGTSRPDPTRRQVAQGGQVKAPGAVPPRKMGEPPMTGELEPLDNMNSLRSLDGTQWPAAVGKIWDAHRSRFSTTWEDVPHHDRLTIYRILTRKTS